MLNIQGSANRLCDGISRRDFLRIGSLGAAGLALPDLWRANALAVNAPANSRAGGFGRAKSCIFLFMRGGPAQQDTWDLKPAAPAEIRGEFKPIATNVPGIQISEHFPLLAQHADKYVVIRSVHHGGDSAQPDHQPSVHLTLTGNPQPVRQREARKDDYPHLGSALARVRPRRSAIPSFVAVGKFPEPEPGTTAGFLGSLYEPFTIDQNPNAPDFRVQDLLALRGDVPLERLAGRRGLLDAVNYETERLVRNGALVVMGNHYEMALGLLGSAKVHQAFDLTAEPAPLRDRYGRNTFGQGVLLARRLVERGVPLVTVNFWTTCDPKIHWDTHEKSFTQLKGPLMPPTDRAFATLLDDLSGRGLLEETLVVWMGEMGRTPRVNNQAGRDHWGNCLTVVLAGGGLSGGRVHGASDSQAAIPKDSPIRSADLATTIYYCLGVDPHTEFPDLVGRPTRICNGQVVPQLLG
jgi:hypothetical protein